MFNHKKFIVMNKKSLKKELKKYAPNMKSASFKKVLDYMKQGYKYELAPYCVYGEKMILILHNVNWFAPVEFIDLED